MRNWDIREFRGRLNWPSPIQQVRVPILWVISRLWRYPNHIKQVILLISHSHSYPPYCSQLYPPFIFFLSTTLSTLQEHTHKSSLSISPSHDHELTLSAAYTEYYIHRVQHTPCTAYTMYSIHRVQHTPCTAYTVYSIHRVQHTPCTAYTVYSIHRVQHTPCTAYTEYSIHPALYTPSTAYTKYTIHWVQHTPKIVCHPFIHTISSWLLNVASSVHPYRLTGIRQFSKQARKVKSPHRIPTVSS